MRTTTPPIYQTGFGNEYASEAVPGALPQGRNSPQRAPLALYPELLSGTAFTAPRYENRRTWLYRRQPSVVSGRYEAYGQAFWQTGGDANTALAPEPLRWNPFPVGDAADGVDDDFVDGIRTLAANGDAQMQTGVAAHIYLATRSMGRRALSSRCGALFVDGPYDASDDTSTKRRTSGDASRSACSTFSVGITLARWKSP